MNNIIMSSLLNNISEVNLRNRNINNTNMNEYSNSFDSILKNSLGQSSSCSCNNRTNDISTLTSMLGLLNNIKINNQNINNTLDNITSVNKTDNEIESSKGIDKALSLVKKQVGKSYVWGSNGPNSFDCSGLTSYIYKEALGKSIPRTSYDQSNFGQKIDKQDLQPGDLVFFDTMNKGRVSHVGIYIGNDEFIHASNPKDGVKKSNLSSSYYQKTYKGARRP